jgi:microcompartment protein CcmK/EutM
MLIARVIGDVVATRKHPSHEGLKVLLVQPLNLDGSDRGDAVIAVDSVDAGAGDREAALQGKGHGNCDEPRQARQVAHTKHGRPPAAESVAALDACGTA